MTRLLACLLAAACSPVAPPVDRPAAPGPPVTSTLPLDTLLSRLAAASSPQARAAAAAALAEPGPGTEERVRALAAMLDDPSKEVRNTAAWALGRLGTASVATLVYVLTDQRASVRAAAVYALGEVGPGAVDARRAVRAALDDPDQSVRDMATWAVGRINPALSEGGELSTAADLAAGLANPDPWVRLSAVQRFHPYTSDRQAAIPILVRALGDADPRIRAGAADALVSIGWQARPAVSAALSDSSTVVRREASITLLRLTRPRLGW